MNTPTFRKLRGYAFDPSVSQQVETAFISEIIYKVPWEENRKRKDMWGYDINPTEWIVNLDEGISGEYVEVIDYDPTVKQYYAPAKLNDPHVLAQDGYPPSEGNPQFHQQMVYAVAMTTIRNFELALGRKVLWSQRLVTVDGENEPDGGPQRRDDKPLRDEYVRALRIYPHAFRGANAYYSPQKKALLFGYFAARPAENTLAMPNSLVFTCLSHDIIAHETAHAILDGMYPKFIENTNPDTRAFHEAFADIIALFQHFTFAEVLKHQIASTRGDLSAENMLVQLAQEFGTAIGRYGSLRSYIGEKDSAGHWQQKRPNGSEYQTVLEAHDRGAILVAAIFEAFVKIYERRSSDLLRIATGGTGVLPQGNLHPDLVNRLATEASKSAKHVLTMCIRGLDYCPPVDITFGDFLRGVITADTDLVPDDDREYRLAFIEAFRRRGIYPDGIRTLSVESLAHPTPNTQNIKALLNKITEFLRDFRNEVMYETDREKLFYTTRDFIAGRRRSPDKPSILGLHRRIYEKFDDSPDFEKITGLVFSHDWQKCGLENTGTYKSDYDQSSKAPPFNIQSLRLASRTTPDGSQRNHIIIALLQKAKVQVQTTSEGVQFSTEKLYAGLADTQPVKTIYLRGGVTLIFDLDSLDLKYAICKPLLDLEKLPKKHEVDRRRALQVYKLQQAEEDLERAAIVPDMGETFYLLHNH